MFTNKVRTLLGAITVGTLVTVAGAAMADEAKAPATVAEHEAMAKTYQDKAASYRKDAEWHKAMADDLRQGQYPTARAGSRTPAT